MKSHLCKSQPLLNIRNFCLPLLTKTLSQNLMKRRWLPNKPTMSAPTSAAIKTRPPHLHKTCREFYRAIARGLKQLFPQRYRYGRGVPGSSPLALKWMDGDGGAAAIADDSDLGGGSHVRRRHQTAQHHQRYSHVRQHPRKSSSLQSRHKAYVEPFCSCRQLQHWSFKCRPKLAPNLRTRLQQITLPGPQ